jgi:urease accessory protein
MLVVESVLGNVETDPELADRYEARPETEIERVVLDERERRRSRVRTATDAGTEVGIVVDGDHDLAPGDVLVDDAERLVVVTFEDREALVVSFEGDRASTETLVRMAELGYRVGNRHWDLAVRDDEVLVALGTDSSHKVREITDALPSGARTWRETVDPTLFDDAGGHGAGGDGDDHTHGHGDHVHSQAGHTHGEGGQDHDHATGYRPISPEEGDDE